MYSYDPLCSLSWAQGFVSLSIKLNSCQSKKKEKKKKENHNKEEEKIRDGGIACAMHADLLPLQQFIQNCVCVYIWFFGRYDLSLVCLTLYVAFWIAR